MRTVLLGLGLVLAFEGLVYALVPGHLKRMMNAMLSLSDEHLRTGGVVALGLGVALVWIAQRLLA